MIKIATNHIVITRDEILEAKLIKKSNALVSGGFDVLLSLIAHTNTTEPPYRAEVSLKTIADEVGFSVVKVVNVIKRLIECEALKKNSTWGRNKALIYDLNIDLFKE